MSLLQPFSGQVVTHGTLQSVLRGYQAPNFKIHRWLAEGRLIGLKKGLYAVVPQQAGQYTSLPLVANQLYGPSHVSLEFALSHYGLIPEAVAQVTSVTTKRGKQFDTPLGRFSYQRVPVAYYSKGIHYVKQSPTQAYMMASPEKALCDWLALTPNLKLYSLKGLSTLLLEDMRMELDGLQQMDSAFIRQLAGLGFRANRLNLLADLMESWTC